LVHDTVENREVAGPTGLYFRAEHPAGLAELCDAVRRDPAAARARGEAAAARARELYSWEQVADQYAELLVELAGRAGTPAPVRSVPAARPSPKGVG
jgi:glycosyltransferase involved in cell wall biosynthesis